MDGKQRPDEPDDAADEWLPGEFEPDGDEDVPTGGWRSVIDNGDVIKVLIYDAEGDLVREERRPKARRIYRTTDPRATGPAANVERRPL